MIVIHYPKDGITYMKGQCGSHSVSSCKILVMITCPMCVKIVKEKNLEIE
jgi:hypothetical protein